MNRKRTQKVQDAARRALRSSLPETARLMFLAIALVATLLFAAVSQAVQSGPRHAGPHVIPEPIDTSQMPVVANVRDFGAVGDGVADDTAAIAQAIGAAARAGGGVVLFPEGTYRVTGRTLPRLVTPITIIGDNTVLRGEGPDKTRILADYREGGATLDVFRAEGRRTGTTHKLTANARAGERVLHVTDANIHFSPGDHIVLEADNTGPVHPISGLAYYRERNHLLIVEEVLEDKLYVTEPLRLDFLVEDNARVTAYKPIRNVVIENLSVHSVNEADLNLILFQYAYRCQVTNVVVSGFTRSGVRINWSKGCVIADTVSRDARWFGGGGQGYGFNVSRSHDNLLERNESQNVRHAFVINFGNGGNLIRYNKTADTTLAAIDVHGEYNYDNLIFENEIHRSGSTGIVIGGGGDEVHYNDGPGNVVQGNVIISSERGVSVRDETHDTIVIGNTIIEARREAILVTGSSHRAQIKDNVIVNPGTVGIYVQGDDAVITGNRLSEVTRTRVGIEIHPRSTGFQVENNVLGGSEIRFPDGRGIVRDNE